MFNPRKKSVRNKSEFNVIKKYRICRQMVAGFHNHLAEKPLHQLCSCEDTQVKSACPICSTLKSNDLAFFKSLS